MALKPILKTLDGLDESVSALYREATEKEVESGGGDPFHILDVERSDGWEVANTGGLLRTIEKLRPAERKLAKFGDLSPDEVEGLRAKNAELEEKLASGKVKDKDAVEAIKAEMAAAHQAEIQGRDEVIEGLEAVLYEEIVERKAGEALIEGGFKGALKVLRPHLLDCLKPVRDASGRLTRDVEVIDPATGNPRVAGSAGDPMTPAQRVAEFMDDPGFARLADGTGSTGAGLDSADAATPTNGVRYIKADDQDAINANFEAIGKGEAIVID